MNKYRLIFRKYFNDGNEEVQNTGNFERVMLARTDDVARTIGDAMVGEEIYHAEWLAELILLEKVEKETPIDICSWNVDDTWERVKNKIAATLDQFTAIEFIIEDDQKVGIDIVF